LDDELANEMLEKVTNVTIMPLNQLYCPQFGDYIKKGTFVEINDSDDGMSYSIAVIKFIGEICFNNIKYPMFKCDYLCPTAYDSILCAKKIRNFYKYHDFPDDEINYPSSIIRLIRMIEYRKGIFIRSMYSNQGDHTVCDDYGYFSVNKRNFCKQNHHKTYFFWK